MKKGIVLFSLVLLLAFLFGCTNFDNDKNSGNDSNSDNEESAQEFLEIKDYYPMKENIKYVYEGKGNEYASYNVYIDYTSEGKVQQRVDNGGTVMAKVVELKDGKITRLLSRGEAYYRENLLETKGDEDEVLLMEPLTEGTTWKIKDSRVRTITDTSVDITTPWGSYKAIEVVTEGSNDKTIDYYAKDVGLVKSVFTSGETEVTSSLSKIEENVSLTQKISFFYPNVNDDKIYYKDKDISFKTNDITRQVLASAYEELADSSLGKVFSANTEINSLYLNKDNMVYIDLNKDFVTEMNAGSGYESMILQSIANTFGKYYNSEKIILTIDNNLYESGHRVMEKGQYIEVKYDVRV
ncbi:GerMN domain-containing protein [Clostridium vincentii]|uniref:Sporulation and spore germination n=1 Tax=Clostridium vincentii TaxID=52704 RepID=A0A2T0B7E2_9CLOT|nr:GerMN domain-containing protein [Clostridium vincentii]PRR79818.1 Sporulation and spore germination [Clostridium vincentii]